MQHMKLSRRGLECCCQFISHYSTRDFASLITYYALWTRCVLPVTVV